MLLRSWRIHEKNMSIAHHARPTPHVTARRPALPACVPGGTGKMTRIFAHHAASHLARSCVSPSVDLVAAHIARLRLQFEFSAALPTCKKGRQPIAWHRFCLQLALRFISSVISAAGTHLLFVPPSAPVLIVSLIFHPITHLLCSTHSEAVGQNPDTISCSGIGVFVS